MRYLMRDGAPLTDSQWGQIDKAVVDEAKKILVGRRFLTMSGPLGAQAQNVPLDTVSEVKAASVDFWGNQDSDPVKVSSRRFLELATVYSDFVISWRDIEREDGAGIQAAADAAMVTASKEDDLIFYGDKSLNIQGIFTAPGINKVPLSDWSKGENPISDLSKALEVLFSKNCSGERALIMSNDLWGKLHRLQPGTGLMEIDRVKSLVSGNVFKSSRIQKNSAALVYCDSHNLDVVIGQDMVTAYLGNEALDHTFRVMETIVPRIKRPAAIAVLS